MRIYLPTHLSGTFVSFVSLFLVMFLQASQSVYANDNGSKYAQCRSDILAVLQRYETALNSGDVDTITALYAKDGIFMPSMKPTASGTDAIRLAYQQVFATLDLNVKFHVDELIWRGDTAILRTTSDGSIKLLQAGATIENHSRELFVLKRMGKDWKFYRYLFNEAQPIQGA